MSSRLLKHGYGAMGGSTLKASTERLRWANSWPRLSRCSFCSIGICLSKVSCNLVRSLRAHRRIRGLVLPTLSAQLQRAYRYDSRTARLDGRS